jgi:hypothetical protein
MYRYLKKRVADGVIMAELLESRQQAAKLGLSQAV